MKHMCIFINTTLPLIVEWVVYRIWSFEVPAMLSCRYPMVQTSALPQWINETFHKNSKFPIYTRREIIITLRYWMTSIKGDKRTNHCKVSKIISTNLQRMHSRKNSHLPRCHGNIWLVEICINSHVVSYLLYRISHSIIVAQCYIVIH